MQGPASYFPSIGQKYGRPIAYWQDTIQPRVPAKRVELVSFLEFEHGMGHGHANALLAVPF